MWQYKVQEGQFERCNKRKYLVMCMYNVCRVSCGGVFNMLLILSITFYFHYNIWSCMCSTGPLSIGDWKDISKAHGIIIIKSEISTFPIVIIFFHACVPGMFVTSYFVTYCIYVTGKLGICFHYHPAVNDEGIYILIRFGLHIVLVCLNSTPSHYHHCENLSKGIELIKCLSDIFCRVC